MNIKNHYDLQLALAQLRDLKDQLQGILSVSRIGSSSDPRSSEEYLKKRTAFELLSLKCSDYCAEVKSQRQKSASEYDYN